MSNIIFKKMLKFFDNLYWKNLIGVIIFLQIISNCGLGAGALKDVSLIVDPPTVRRNQHATLRCLYDLEGAPLYQVKFYRGLREFFRYSPGEQEFTKTQIFPYPKIYVDPHLSNASQVVLRNVTFGLSGNFSCEVSAEAPKFSTATACYDMQVVELPDRRPMLWTSHDRYEPGDVLKANCSSPPSRPKTELTLTLNNIVVASEHHSYSTNDGLFATKLGFRLQLQSSHFGGPVPSPGNSLVLRCTAQIGNFYQEYTEIELGVPQRDPIPARVTSSRVADFKKFKPTIPQLTTIVLTIVIFSQNIHHMLFR